MELEKVIVAESAGEQYSKFKRSQGVASAEIEKFAGVDGYDVYNPSVPFELGGVRYIAARVEKRDDENSVIRIFKNGGGDVWQVVDSMILPLQDPFVTVIDGKIILGGVRVKHFSDHAEWTTEFYRVNTLDDFEFLASGPRFMKDIRLLQLTDGRIAVFSRPHGEVMKKFGRLCAIGFTIINCLAELNADIIASAPLLSGQFIATEWGGCNQLFNLANGLIGVIGHKSYRTYEDGEQRLHYYGMAFAINPITRELSQTKVIISRDCFGDAEPKRADLADVTFAAGIERLGGTKARIYTGLSDSHVGSAVINDPFTEYEIN